MTKRAVVLAFTVLAFLPLTAAMAADKPSFQSVDKDGDGKVSIKEAVKAGVPKKAAEKQDLDKDGQLTKTDWDFVKMEPPKSQGGQPPSTEQP